jgi:hypothetical protein
MGMLLPGHAFTLCLLVTCMHACRVASATNSRLKLNDPTEGEIQALINLLASAFAAWQEACVAEDERLQAEDAEAYAKMTEEELEQKWAATLPEGPEKVAYKAFQAE